MTPIFHFHNGSGKFPVIFSSQSLVVYDITRRPEKNLWLLAQNRKTIFDPLFPIPLL